MESHDLESIAFYYFILGVVAGLMLGVVLVCVYQVLFGAV